MSKDCVRAGIDARVRYFDLIVADDAWQPDGAPVEGDDYDIDFGFQPAHACNDALEVVGLSSSQDTHRCVRAAHLIGGVDTQRRDSDLLWSGCATFGYDTAESQEAHAYVTARHHRWQAGFLEVAAGAGGDDAF